MQTLEYRDVVDKSEWNRGEWDKEPDKKQWSDESTGYPCLIVRGPSGSLCGYVGVDERHPHFEDDYDGPSVEVHGGLTFASFCQPEDQAHGICHVVEDGENDRVWWFGFDCAHGGDVMPAFDKTYSNIARQITETIQEPNTRYGFSIEYRDWAYVEEEVTALARQLKELAA